MDNHSSTIYEKEVWENRKRKPEEVEASRKKLKQANKNISLMSSEIYKKILHLQNKNIMLWRKNI